MRYIIDSRKVDFWLSDKTYNQMDSMATRLKTSIEEVVKMTCHHLLDNQQAIKSLSRYFIRHTTINNTYYRGGNKPHYPTTNCTHRLRMDINPILAILKTMSFALNMPIRDTLSFVLEICYSQETRRLATN